MTDFTIIARSMRARLFSTVVTAITVAVAVGLLITLLSMKNAGRQAFERGSGNMDLLVSGDSSPMVAVLNGVFYANAPARPIAWEVFERIKYDPRIDWAVPTQQGDSFQGFPVLATEPEFFEFFKPEPDKPWVFAAGRAFKDNFEVVLGAQAARGTGLGVGSKLFLTHGTAESRDAHVHEEFTYTVVGVLAPTGGPHDRAVFSNLESTWIVHAFDKHHHDHDHDHDHDHGNPNVVLTDDDRLITGIYLAVAKRPGLMVGAVMPQVAAGLRAESGFTVAQPKSEMDRLFRIVSNVDVVFRALAMVVLVSSGIAIMLALYNSMNDRRRQIAVLRVLGCSRGRVFGLVLTESAMLGLIGAAAGLGIAAIGGLAAAGQLRRSVGLVITPVYEVGWLVPVLVGAVLLAALAGLIPAFMAYRTGVAKNLKPLG
ncbi:MAG: ABC transporter permease [Phycisphaerales bacterium]